MTFSSAPPRPPLASFGDIRATLDQKLRGPVPSTSTGSWSWPVFTLPVGDLILTEIAVEYRGGVAYQVYAVDNGADGGVLVGWFGLHVDALREINVWRTFVAGGGTLARWVKMHPDGVQMGAHNV